jgi:recombination DNA repair RAD52 pathway protein
MNYLPDEGVFWTQLEQLFKPINTNRVQKRQGQSYLESWDVAAHLTRIFGPLNWSTKLLASDLVFEEKRETGKWDVCYRAFMRLEVNTDRGAWAGPCIHEDVGTGTASNQPDRGSAHDQALKTAASDAMKRCARLLGNQFGLSLYDGGSVGTVVSSSLAHPNPFEEGQ